VNARSGHGVAHGTFLKTTSALGCGILHLDPKDVSFEWMKLDISTNCGKVRWF
jgi:hypothetical protein